MSLQPGLKVARYVPVFFLSDQSSIRRRILTDSSETDRTLLDAKSADEPSGHHYDGSRVIWVRGIIVLLRRRVLPDSAIIAVDNASLSYPLGKG